MLQYELTRARQRRGWVRPLWIIAALVIMALGVIALPAPGPGFLVIGVGIALLARESRFAARLADALELKARALLAWMKESWRRASTPLRAMVAVGAAGLAAGVAWLVWVAYLRDRLC